eukprot:scaffold4387_cov400-Prasinococcus_capsulatus_cf.AAC.11
MAQRPPEERKGLQKGSCSILGRPRSPAGISGGKERPPRRDVRQGGTSATASAPAGALSASARLACTRGGSELGAAHSCSLQPRHRSPTPAPRGPGEPAPNPDAPNGGGADYPLPE